MPDNQESPSKELEEKKKGGDLNEELLPCPFCGGEAEIEQQGTGRISTIYSCADCGCKLETGETWQVPGRWNQREQLTATQQALDSSCQTNEVLAKRLVMCRKFFESISRLTTRLDLLDEEIRLRVFNEVESALSTIEGK